MASVDEKQGHGRVLEFDKVTKSFAKTVCKVITHALEVVILRMDMRMLMITGKVRVMKGINGYIEDLELQ